MKVWHITSDVDYGGNLLYNLTNNAKSFDRKIGEGNNTIYKIKE